VLEVEVGGVLADVDTPADLAAVADDLGSAADHLGPGRTRRVQSSRR
jgi:hypothetical protein